MITKDNMVYILKRAELKNITEHQLEEFISEFDFDDKGNVLIPYQHKGYMCRGVKLLIEECKKMNITKLYAKVDKNNVYSKKVLDNTGFLQQVYNGDVLLYMYEIKR